MAAGPKLSFEQWYYQVFYPKYGGTVGQAEAFKMYQDYLQDTEEIGAKTWDDLVKGNISGVDAQGTFAGAGVQLSPDQQEYLNNVIASDASKSANEFTEHMRDTSVTSAASQYSSLGFNPATVMSTGGAGVGSASTPDTSMRNNSQDTKVQKMNNEAAMTRTVLSIVGGLANAGIHGTAIGAARSAASKIASATAHSALAALYRY